MAINRISSKITKFISKLISEGHNMFDVYSGVQNASCIYEITICFSPSSVCALLHSLISVNRRFETLLSWNSRSTSACIYTTSDCYDKEVVLLFLLALCFLLKLPCFFLISPSIFVQTTMQWGFQVRLNQMECKSCKPSSMYWTHSLWGSHLCL